MDRTIVWILALCAMTSEVVAKLYSSDKHGPMTNVTNSTWVTLWYFRWIKLGMHIGRKFKILLEGSSYFNQSFLLLLSWLVCENTGVWIYENLLTLIFLISKLYMVLKIWLLFIGTWSMNIILKSTWPFGIGTRLEFSWLSRYFF